MKATFKNPLPSMGILLRTTLLSWFTVIVTLIIFISVILPAQRKALIQNLESKAHGVTASLQNIAAGAALSEDFSAVVDHCMKVLSEDDSIDFLVLTRNDGFSLIHKREAWRSDQLEGDWNPENRRPHSQMNAVLLGSEAVFHYAHPFDYSGIQWGWIHIGLSLENYHKTVTELYYQTGIAAVLCIFFGLVASVLYARRLTRPIVHLQGVVQRLAGGDLSVRANAGYKDEVGALAQNFNKMTDSIVQRNRILQSVSFVAQQFLAAENWHTIIETALSKLGKAADVSRMFAYRNHFDRSGVHHAKKLFEWICQDCERNKSSLNLEDFALNKTGFDGLKASMEKGLPVTRNIAKFTSSERQFFEPYGIQSLIIMPVRVRKNWWGFIGFAEDRFPREWSEAEHASLQAAADTLGAAIERQQSKQALVMAKERAEAASLAKSQFLANMSHELRTPLNHIIGFTEMVVDKYFGDLTPVQSEYLNDVLNSSRHLLSLINDILDLSKVEAGKLELEPSNVNLKVLIENSLIMVKEKAMKHGIRLSSHINGVPETLLADERKLKQILYNLLSNAVKFTSKGGSIQIEAKRYADGGETPENIGNGHDDFIEISVIDSGIGLISEDLERIFCPFEQADNSAGRQYQGTGLGLSLTQRLVELHGGRIWAESEGKGNGSTFRMIIPIIGNFPDSDA